MELSQAISQAIKEFGKDIITEPRFVNILADYDAFAESKQMRMVVKDMVEQGFTKRLVSFDPSLNDIRDKINSFVYEALNLFPFREEVVTDFISATLHSIAEMGNKSAGSASDSKNYDMATAETPREYFEFSEDGKTLIKASRKLEGKIIIPSGTEVIGANSFCCDITEVIVPEGVKRIEQEAFRCCKLTKVLLPESLEELEPYCFYYCYKLHNIFLPKGVKSIGFALCQGYIDVDPENIYFKSIEGSVLSKNGEILYYVSLNKTYYKVPDGVKELDYCFYGCAKLETVILPDSLKVISSFAFCYCEKLDRIVIPEGVQKLGCDAFACCKSLKEIEIPESIKTIESDLFESTWIEKVTFKTKKPKGIKWIHYKNASYYKDDFWGTRNETVFYVPQESLGKYVKISYFENALLIPVASDGNPAGCDALSITHKIPTNYKTKDNFCHVENIVLGKTTCTEAKCLGYKIVKSWDEEDPCLYANGKNGYFSIHNTKDCFYSYSCSKRFPSEWSEQGLDSYLSYNQFISLFKSWGFAITIKKDSDSSSGFSAESFDKSITFVLIFEFGKIRDDIAFIRANTLDSISLVVKS